MDNRKIIIFETVYNQIFLLLEKKPKVEAVGLCFGECDKKKITLRSFKQMVNLDNSATSFSLDYEVLYREIQHHEKKEEILVGIFHSHPEGEKLYPSQKDLKFMHYWPAPYLWLIGGCQGDSNNIQLEIFSLLDEVIIRIPYLVINH